MDIEYTVEFLTEFYNNLIPRKRKTCGPPRTKYTELRSKFRKHSNSFSSMHSRSTYIDPKYSRTPEGLINFIADLGPVPDGMSSPSIGRLDHSLGYIPGNFEWQDRWENAKDSHNRRDSESYSKLHKGKVYYNDGIKNYRFYPTDPEPIKLGLQLGAIKYKKTSTCPHCNKTGEFRAMKLWHFNKCKQFIGPSILN